MEDLNDKVTGGTLTATEWNQVPSEIQSVIEGLGITLSSGDLNQLGKAIAGYVANGSFYTDSGAVNALVLTTIGSKQSPTAYTDGMEAICRPAIVNTGASTVNVAGLGVKNIKTKAGVDVSAGDLPLDELVRLIYDAGNGWFELTVISLTNQVDDVLQSRFVDDGAFASGTTAIPFDNTIPQNTEGDEYLTLSITPKSTNSKLVVESIANLGFSASGDIISALFIDSVANAIAAASTLVGSGSTQVVNLALKTEYTNTTLATKTFKLRCGNGAAGTTYFNGSAGVGKFGGVFLSSITITEIEL